MATKKCEVKPEEKTKTVFRIPTPRRLILEGLLLEMRRRNGARVTIDEFCCSAVEKAIADLEQSMRRKAGAA